MKQWQCTICKYVHKGDAPPEKCPVCGAPASKFVEIKTEDSEVSPGPGSLKKEKIEKPAPVIKETGLQKIGSLLVKHHAHPVLVHTPNGILPFAVILFFLSWIFDYDLLSKVAFINLIFVVIALPLVFLTGILEWKKKYNSALTLTFKLKIFAATLTCVSCVISLCWYLIDPKILSSPKALIFIFINIIMLAAAGIAGHIGGKLVFKD